GLNQAHVTRIDDAGAFQRVEFDAAKLPPHVARDAKAAVGEVDTVNILDVDAERHLLGVIALQFHAGRRRGLRGPAYEQQDENGDEMQQGGHPPARTQTQYQFHPYAPLGSAASAVSRSPRLCWPLKRALRTWRAVRAYSAAWAGAIFYGAA